MYFFYSDAKPTLKLIIGKERIKEIENRENREQRKERISLGFREKS